MCAGGADPIVSTPAARRFFDTLGSSDKTLDRSSRGMRHEVLCEVGKRRSWADISGWISAHR